MSQIATLFQLAERLRQRGEFPGLQVQLLTFQPVLVQLLLLLGILDLQGQTLLLLVQRPPA